MLHKPSLITILATDPDRAEQVVTLKGKLIGTPECYAFLDETRERIQDGLIRVILDLSQVELINSTGAGILAALLISARRQNGGLALVGLSDRCLQVLEFMHLHHFAAICDSIDVARDILA
ncbi:MAG TPA: STAS domain-containing protein [Candidatus Krumholzibacteria bacterium]|nr:STAS domain-containing protein [Candidatus Krumholzibacteria bacterium]HPD72589.1 STAS domain-containing protein [Candidatus Krumholzibacteria bacterium]HRY40479.1 STAS domain-containing protein [Candidatus Krumholzibacteria bacterium]